LKIEFEMEKQKKIKRKKSKVAPGPKLLPAHSSFSPAQPVSPSPASLHWCLCCVGSPRHPLTDATCLPTARCRHLGPAGQPLRVRLSRCWLGPACHPGRGGSNNPRGSHDELPLSRVNWTTLPTPHDQTLNTTPILPRLPLTRTHLRYP
jgi:hypothetical protein